MLEKGAALIHRQGYHHTGIQQIVDAAGVPKGSFYFYFKSKQAFGLAVIDGFSASYRALAERHLVDPSLPPLERLKAFYGAFRDFFVSSNCGLGCPVGNLTLELADTDDVFRSRLNAAWDGMIAPIRDLLIAAQGAGELSTSLDPDDWALFLVSGWEGAIAAMKTRKDIGPLEVFEKLTLAALTSFPGPTSVSDTTRKTDPNTSRNANP